MFIEQAISRENGFWKYIVGTLVIIVASFIGQMPLVGAIFAKSISDGKPFPLTTEQVLGFLEPNLTLFLMLLAFAVTLAAVFITVKFLNRQSIRSVTTARKKVDWSRIFFAFALWGVFTTVMILIDYFISPEDYVFNFRPIPFAILAVIAIIMIPIQTSAEEYIFRGYLMQGIGSLALNRWVPLMVTSVIFGLMHISNPEVAKMGYTVMIFYIGTGFLLGIMTLMDDGMELALGFHAANNLIGALLVTSEWTAFRTDSILKDISNPTAGTDVLIPVLIIYPILLFIFSKKYNWSGWTEKLTGKIEVYGNTLPQEDARQPDL